jgi:transposase
VSNLYIKEGVDIMPFIEGQDRNQMTLLPNTLEDYVSEDNPVRVIDAYVNSIDLEDMGFVIFTGQKAGQRPYKRRDLLKLYIYCYMNRIRSSRRVEIEATRNIELMWLIGKISPDHGTISSFMKNNRDSIKKLFKEFSLMLKGFGLIDGNLMAIDGTKIKANCAKSKHYNENIISKKMEYYESKVEEYLNDFIKTTDDENLKQKMTEKIDSYKKRIEQLNTLKKELKEEGKTQVCLTDPDSKSMKNNGKFEVCFNMQTVVDSKNKLFVAVEVVNDINDQGQLSNMINNAKKVFEEDRKIAIVADTGYYNMSEIVKSVDLNTEILIKSQKGKQEKILNGFDKTNFQYNKANDTYLCPKGYILAFKWNGKQNGNDYRRYTCENYMDCGVKCSCTSSKSGRSVTRLKEEEIIQAVNENTIQKNSVYKKRGTIVEHPFGTIKRHFGYTYFLTRGLDSVNTEGSFICLAYNLKRLINILGVRELVRRFKALISRFLDIFKIIHRDQHKNLVVEQF